MYFQAKLFFKQVFYKKPIIWQILETIQGLKYSLNHWYYYGLLNGQNGFSIREVNIELNSSCNLRCKFCSLDHSKPRDIISNEILESFLSGFIKNNDRYRHIKRINLYNGGELLLHPKRIDMLKIIGEYKHAALNQGLFFPEVFMLTNGMLLREKLAVEILDLNVIDTLSVSFDGGYPNTFEKIRVNAKWSVFYNNIKTFDRLRKEKQQRIKMCAISCIPEDKKRSIKWMHPEFQEIYQLLDWYELRRFHNWAGEIEEIKIPKKRHKIGCSLLMEQMVLLPNGDITICCNDLNSKAVIGNITKNSFEEVYNSPTRRNYLKLHLKGKKDEIEFCRSCETF